MSKCHHQLLMLSGVTSWVSAVNLKTIYIHLINRYNFSYFKKKCLYWLTKHGYGNCKVRKVFIYVTCIFFSGYKISRIFQGKPCWRLLKKIAQALRNSVQISTSSLINMRLDLFLLQNYTTNHSYWNRTGGRPGDAPGPLVRWSNWWFIRYR